MKLWKLADPQVDSIPPLVVETYLDLRDLGPQHSLILTDSTGKTWEVTKGTKRNEVVLERWIVEFIPALGDSKDLDWDDSSKESQPTAIYKQAVILMRSLYSYSRILPAWNLRRKLSRSKLTVSPLKVGCRILNGAHRIPSKGRVGLTKQIKELGESELEAFSFTDVKTALGNLRISVSYRYECNFSVGDMESVLSNHFYDLDKSRIAAAARRQSVSTLPYNPASLPSPSRSLEGGSSMASRINVYKHHAKHASYASSADFPIEHASGNAMSSPTDVVPKDRRLSNLSIRDSAYSPVTNQIYTGSGTPPTGSVTSSHSPTSARPSVSFIQPFKTPSLSASPSDTPMVGTPNTTYFSRPPSFPRTGSNSSLVASLRIPGRSMSNASNTSVNSYTRAPGSVGVASDNAISSSISSSRSSSVPKFSSSFSSRGSNWNRSGSISSGTRPKRLSNAGENPSSLGSNSSFDPGASFLIDDDDGLGEFRQMVESIRTANSTNSVLLSGGSSASSSSVLFGSTSRPIATSGFMGASTSDSDVLSKFQNMKTNHSVLSDSLIGSQHRSPDRSETSSSSSPHANQGSYPIPSSSPPSVARSISQHTPSVPSRLSEEFTASNDSFKAYYHSHPRKHGSRSSLKVDEELFGHDGDDGEPVSGSAKINPLDIPVPSSLTRPTRRESLSVSNRRTSGFRDMQDGIKTSHHQSLGATGHIFPGKELSSFRSNPGNNGNTANNNGNNGGAGNGNNGNNNNSNLIESKAHNIPLPQRRPSRIVQQSTDRYSTDPMDALSSQVRHVDLSYAGASRKAESGQPEDAGDYQRRNRFSYYTRDDDEEDHDKRIREGSTDSMMEDEDDGLIFAMNERDGSPPHSSRYQGTSTNRYDVLSCD